MVTLTYLFSAEVTLRVFFSMFLSIDKADSINNEGLIMPHKFVMLCPVEMHFQSKYVRNLTLHYYP